MDLIQPAAAIVLVLALLGGVLAALRRREGNSFRSASSRRPARKLEVVERVSLSSQHSIHLVRAQGRTVLVATGPHSCQMVHCQVEDARAVETPDPSPLR